MIDATVKDNFMDDYFENPNYYQSIIEPNDEKGLVERQLNTLEGVEAEE